MAEKKVFELEVKTNSEDIQGKFASLRSEISKTTEEIEQLTDAYGENSEEVKQASEKLESLKTAYKDLNKVATDVGATFEYVYGEIQPVSGRMGELEDRLYELAAAGKQNTQEFKDIQEQVAKFKRVIIETDASVDGASGTMSQKLGGALGGVTAGFELAQGAMVAFGVESQEVEEALLKVQSAMAISQGVQGIKESISSFQSLGATVKNAFSGMTTASKAFIATGVGLVIAAVAYAISEMTSAAEAAAAEIENLEKATENLNDELQFSQKQLSDYSRKAIADAKLRGASEKELLQIELDASQKSIEQRWNNANQRIKANNRIINNENATAEQIKKANSEIFKAQQEQLELKREASILSSEFALREKEIADDEIAKNKERAKEAKERAKEAKAKRIADEKEKNDKLKELAEDKAKFDLEQIELDEIRQEQAYQRKLDAAAKAAEEEKAMEDALRAERLAAEEADEKRQEDAYKRRLEGEEKLQELKYAAVLQGLTLISDLSEVFAKKGEKQAKRAFEIQKAASLAAAVITTYQSAVSAYQSQFLPLPDPTSPIRGAIAAGIAVAAGLGNVAKIASQKFEGGGSISASPTPSGGGGGGGATGGNVVAPNFNLVGNAQATNPLAGLGEGLIQAYVVSGDVTTAQSLDRNRVNNATFG
jgi:hypothetical protein